MAAAAANKNCNESCACHTGIGAAAGNKYVWTIDDVRKHYTDHGGNKHLVEGVVATSDKFKYNDHTWYLDLYYVVSQISDYGTYRFRLNLNKPTSHDFIRFKVEHNLSIYRNGQKIAERVGVSDLSNEMLMTYISAHIGEQKLQEAGTLAMCCELQAAQYHIHAPPNNIIQDLNQKLLESGAGADAKLTVKGKNGEGAEQIPVHTNILGTRSTVFAAMFSHEMVETRTREVEIVDATSSTIKDMLQFIYTGSIEPPLDFDRALSLLPCAEKYDLAHLKIMCGEVLDEKLTNDNAAAVLGIALQCEYTELGNIASKFIMRNTQRLAATLANGNQIENIKDLSQLIVELKITTDNMEELIKNNEVKDAHK